MADIQDFGEKIGGARKDMWRLRGLLTDDLTEMNAMERKTHIKKDNIWLRPNWEAVIAEGTPQAVAYWQNKMRQSLPPRPPRDDEETQTNYVSVVQEFRDAVMAVRTGAEVKSFYTEFLRKNYIDPSSRGYYVTIVPRAKDIVTNKVLKAAQSSFWKMEAEARSALFGVPKEEQTYEAMKQSLSVLQYDNNKVTVSPDDRDPDRTILKVDEGLGRYFYYLSEKSKFHVPEKWQEGKFFVLDANHRTPVEINFDSREEAEAFVEKISRAAQDLASKDKAEGKNKEAGKKRKGAFIPPQLRHVKRTGPDYRQGRPAVGDMFLKEFQFRGGEFGNWLNDADRQTSLNMAYEAFYDLARTLGIHREDVSLGNSLAIAFGARGRGGANAGAAHYEPDRQVINLTKMSGAGCLAHEWGHALDHAIGVSCGITGFATEAKSKRELPAAFTELLQAMQYKQVALSPEELAKLKEPELERCRKNLKAWISGEKPSKLPPDLAAKWDETAQSIFDNAKSFVGGEYFQLNRSSPVLTRPEVELLSQIRKQSTNHVIPRESKQQICLWARSLGSCQKEIEAGEPTMRREKTDFYKGSIAFDGLYSRSSHGYWKSECEMFARAFDCYVADKLRAEGVKSDYLSAHADSFAMPDGNGNIVYAYPRGEERARINELFDKLLEQLKDRDVLHAFTDEAHLTEYVRPAPVRERPVHRNTEPDGPQPKNFEQLSFDEMLFSATNRANGPAASRSVPDRDRTR